MEKLTKQEIQKLAEENDLIIPKNMSDRVLNTITKYVDEGSLSLPKHYTPANALKSAWLKIQETVDKTGKKAVDVCTQTSIANALLETIVLGLNPAKTQCYYIVYGDKLTMMPSYFGKQSALKRTEGVESISANVIYDGDEFTYEIRSDGSIHSIVHKQQFENIDEEKIKGGYAVVTYKGKEYGVVQNITQIKTAWKGAKQKGFDKKNFKAEFVKRTMINLVVKHFLQTTDDGDLVQETIIANENQHYEFENVGEVVGDGKPQQVEVDETQFDETQFDEETGEILEKESPTKKPSLLDELGDDSPY